LLLFFLKEKSTKAKIARARGNNRRRRSPKYANSLSLSRSSSSSSSSSSLSGKNREIGESGVLGKEARREEKKKEKFLALSMNFPPCLSRRTTMENGYGKSNR
jgi:hypothetical protein